MSVRVSGLTRSYRNGKGWRPKGAEVVALDQLSLAVEQGEVHGLLGPNGAGKTTLCKILSTILLPTAGTAEVLGHDVVAEAPRVRELIGIVFGGERGLYWKLTARQNLRYWAAMYKLPDQLAQRRCDELLDRLGLADRADDLVETYSRGMKQRVHLARGLIGDPRLVLFDEPTTGMDPVSAHDFRDLIAELRAEGRTILITTHDMAEAEAVCDRVTLVDKGKVVATETPRGLAKMSALHRWVEADDTDLDLGGLPGVVDVVQRDGLLRVKTDGDDSARSVVDFLLSNGIRSVRVVQPTLEDVYLDVIGSRGMGV
ncbi:ABC transporter ATP-binding protein [Lentzea flaviverrucosa]|uniref:ABC-2 type transport system ATP-binding protein n=1 Tax=Lentzea flaviverrucosa TaxID=200379 RepID=A0A1H9WTY7_9PSEU|nr:ABC transporter ATP-binding protein [Lentzea flaviverrucosa]RDI23104.1 ABC-2 type transport system ATP-binding protein [Lentzea flaviverrucosa]SES37402.1 ABC-2 type transport system ATP-binding protein [Lentzea flaviverrucosa]